jgi:signal transduction histidine kinase/ActR/RegA family two-component response regulator
MTRVDPRIALLAAASALLGEGPHIDQALAKLARVGLPHLGDLCAIDLTLDDGTLSRVASAHVLADKESLVTALTPVERLTAIASRRATGLPRAGRAALEGLAESADQRAQLERLGARTWLCVPLIGTDRVLGALTFAVTESGRRYSPADQHLAAVLAKLTAAVIESARLRDAAVDARRAAEAAARARDEFLATLSHELRNPLNAVLGWATLLESGRLDAEQARRAIRVILRNVDAQARLVEDLLEMSSAVLGRTRLSIRPVEVRAVAIEVVDALRPGAEAKGVRLESRLESPGAVVSGDPDRLRQVIWNLLANAVKFTPAGGRVEISVARVRSHLELRVSDTGQGIHPDLLPHVFDRLRQGDSTSTRAHGGVGIGLALVRHLVELHGGAVRARSPGEGQGATFTVTLPLTAVEIRDPAPPREPLSAASLAGVRVLVVDDDPAAVELVVETLAQRGAEAKGAGSVAAALPVLTAWRPTVLISDIEMPGADGYALIREVRTLAPEAGGRTPAVALTAFSRPEDRVRILRAGFSLHVTKPVDPEELITIVATLAGNGAGREEQP